MKHLKLFENNKSISSIKNIMNNYNDMIEELHPIIFDEYNRIASSSELNYGQDICDKYGGESYTFLHNIDNTKIIEMTIHDNKIFFTLESYDNYEEKPNEYFIPFTDDELEQTIIRYTTNKYNL